MIKSFRLTGLLFLALSAFVACDKEDNNINSSSDELNFLVEADNAELVDALVFPTDEDFNEARRDNFSGEAKPRFAGDCYTLVFPVTIEFPNGGQVVADSAGAIRAAIERWIRSNPDRTRPKVRPSLVFPLDVQVADGTIKTIESQLGLQRLARSCRPEAERCLTLLFPASYKFGDRLLTFASAADLRTALHRYHSDSTQTHRTRPTMVFPVQFESASGDTLTINNVAELERLRASCGVRGGHPNGNHDCYTFVYPLGLSNAAGRTISVNNKHELRRALSHANDRGRFTFVYPFNVTMANGTVVAITNAELFGALRRRCQ